jgi:RNA polymerase sigma-70 factor, ECF subfamily
MPKTSNSAATAAEPQPEQSSEDEVIPVELAGTTKLVPRSAVRYVEAQGDYARLHTNEGSHFVRIPLSVLEDRWRAAGFVRVHRSFLVALPLVSELRLSGSGYVVRVGSGPDCAELPVSRRHTRELKDRLVSRSDDTRPPVSPQLAPEAQDDPNGSWALVKAAQAGDMAAFGGLFDKYYDVVFRYVLFRISDRSLAEDLTQETFVRALRRISSVSDQGRDIGAWFITIARNLIFDHVKSSHYRLEQTTNEIIELSPSTGGPDQQVLDSATNEELLRCVRKLNPDQQELFNLRFLQGLSVAETAQIMDRKEGAVKALQHRVVRRLAQLLPEGLRDDDAALLNAAETRGARGFGQFVERVAANLDPDAAAADVLGAAAYRDFADRVRAQLDVSAGLRAVLAVVPPSLNGPITTPDPAGEPPSDPAAELAPDALLDQEIETAERDLAGLPAGSRSSALRVRLAVLLKQRYVEHTGDDADWNRAAVLFDEAVRLADEDDGFGRTAIVDAASASDDGRYDVALRLAHDIFTITTASGEGGHRGSRT